MPCIRDIRASSCFLFPFAVPYKLYIIRCFNQSYIFPAHIMILSNSLETEVETISQRELRSASGLDFLRRSLLYRTCLWFSLKHRDPFWLLPLRCVWAVLAWTAASCDFSEMLKSLMVLAWYFFSVKEIVQNWQSSLLVTSTCNNVHLWLWQWWRPHVTIRWVKQEVSFVSFLSSTFLLKVGSCSRAFVFLLSCEVLYCFFKRNANFSTSSSNVLVLFCFFFLQRGALPSLYSEVLSLSSVSDWLNAVFAQSFAFLIDWLFISYDFYASFLFPYVNLEFMK